MSLSTQSTLFTSSSTLSKMLSAKLQINPRSVRPDRGLTCTTHAAKKVVEANKKKTAPPTVAVRDPETTQQLRIAAVVLALGASEYRV